jgi:hypothetical protein
MWAACGTHIAIIVRSCLDPVSDLFRVLPMQVNTNFNHYSKEPPKKDISDDGTLMCKRTMNIGTWNVRSLFWSGPLKILHNELSKLDFDIVALQET